MNGYEFVSPLDLAPAVELAVAPAVEPGVAPAVEPAVAISGSPGSLSTITQHRATLPR